MRCQENVVPRLSGRTSCRQNRTHEGLVLQWQPLGPVVTTYGLPSSQGEEKNTQWLQARQSGKREQSQTKQNKIPHLVGVPHAVNKFFTLSRNLAFSFAFSASWRLCTFTFLFACFFCWFATLRDATILAIRPDNVWDMARRKENKWTGKASE